MGIETLLIMIPKGGMYAKSVVNFVHKSVKNWPMFKAEIEKVLNLLKGGRLKLHGKQKTNFEANKNILKNHEKVTKKVEVPPSVKKKFPPFNVSKEDFTKGWTPTLIERSKARNIYKELEPPKEKYTKEMEAIDEELDALAFGDKYEGLSVAEKNKIMKKLQTEMQKLIKVAMKEDLTKLSLSQINKRSQSLQKRIREIANNPDIKGTVTEGPKRDMIKAIYDSENPALTNARKVITKRNSELKYGTKFPRLDPENDAFIITGLDSSGNPMKVGRWSGRFSALKDPKTGELTRKEGTSYYDKWDAEKNQIRKSNEEVWHETVDAEGKTIMSNPDYKVTTKNTEIWNELYSDMSISDLSKKGFKLKDIDMLVKGREVKKYLTAQEASEKGLDTGIKMHERTSSSSIGKIMEDLYYRGDDVYKMSMKEWITKIPEHFAEGGRTGFHQGSLRHQKEHDYRSYEDEGTFMKYLLLSGDRAKSGPSPEGGVGPYSWRSADTDEKMGYDQWRDDFETMMKERFMYGEQKPPSNFEQIWADIKKLLDKKRNKHATGGISNLFQERQGYRDPGLVIKLAKGARWVIRMLKELSDDMIFGSEQFAKMAESLKIKLYKETQAAIKHLEAGGEIPKNLIQSLRQDARFKDLTVTGKDKEFIEIQEVILGKTKPTKSTGEIIEGTVVEEIGTGEKLLKGTVVDEKVELFAFMNELPKDLQHKIGLLPVEQQVPLLRKFKKAFDATKTGGAEGGVDVLQKQLLEDFIPKGKGNAEGGRIGFNSGGNGGTHPLLPELEALTWKSLRQQLSQKEMKRMEYLIEATGTLDDYKAQGGLIPGYATGGVSNLFRSR